MAPALKGRYKLLSALSGMKWGLNRIKLTKERCIRSHGVTQLRDRLGGGEGGLQSTPWALQSCTCFVCHSCTPLPAPPPLCNPVLVFGSGTFSSFYFQVLAGRTSLRSLLARSPASSLLFAYPEDTSCGFLRERKRPFSLIISSLPTKSSPPHRGQIRPAASCRLSYFALLG